MRPHDLDSSWSRSWVENLGFEWRNLDSWSNELKTVPLGLQNRLFCAIFAYDLDGPWSRSWVENRGMGLRHLDPCSNPQRM